MSKNQLHHPINYIYVHTNIPALAFRVILLSISLIFFSCEKKPEPTVNEKLSFNEEDYHSTFRNLVQSSDSTDKFISIIKTNFDSLKLFYSQNGFNPVFVKSYESKKLIDSVIFILSNANTHGISSERYNLTLIDSLLSKAFDSSLTVSNRLTKLSYLELLLANDIINYSSHLRHGIINPRKIYASSYFLPVTDSLNKRYFEPIKQNSIVKYLLDIQPKSEKYLKMQSALSRFEKLQHLDWKSIPEPEKKIEPGDRFASLQNVYDRLAILGFLDTSKTKISIPELYDSVLAEPVKLFQKANGLNDDGVIGKSTTERLNITPKEYVTKIKLNLERFRWINYSDTAKYILVNIPDFRVFAIENQKELFSIKICTGRKIEWETPVQYGQIDKLILNPTWTVPQSIIQEEIVQGLRRDSLYLKKKSFKIYKAGERVSADGLTVKDLSSKRFSLIQDPGAGNALGKIKFMFNNPFGVYLHDTPTRAPFNYVNRAVSHGCMRVEKPMVLANYLLKNNSNWLLDYIKIEIGQKTDDETIVNEFKAKRNELRKNSSYGVTTEVKLFNKIPLFVDYYTCWVDENGFLNYRDDVYDRDKILQKVLLNN